MKEHCHCRLRCSGWKADAVLPKLMNDAMELRMLRAVHYRVAVVAVVCVKLKIRLPSVHPPPRRLASAMKTLLLPALLQQHQQHHLSLARDTRYKQAH